MVNSLLDDATEQLVENLFAGREARDAADDLRLRGAVNDGLRRPPGAPPRVAVRHYVMSPGRFSRKASRTRTAPGGFTITLLRRFYSRAAVRPMCPLVCSVRQLRYPGITLATSSVVKLEAAVP